MFKYFEIWVVSGFCFFEAYGVRVKGRCKIAQQFKVLDLWCRRCTSRDWAEFEL